MSSDIEIVECTTPQQRDEFIFFQWVPYQHGQEKKNWVPPLISERREFYDKAKHPFHKHAEVAMFLAKRNGQTVGTIYAIENYKYNEFHNEKLGMFGGFETIDDQAVANTLLNKAAEWCKARGLTAMRGPFNFSTNEECGLLIDAFDDTPRPLMTYNPPYYQKLVETAGFSKAMDLLAYHLEVKDIQKGIDALPAKLKRVTDMLMKKNEITIRKVDMKHLDEEITLLKKVYNSAWEKNWGFVPMTDEEFEHLANGLKPVLDPDLIFVVEAKGQPIGFSLTLPDVNVPLLYAHPHPKKSDMLTQIQFFANFKLRRKLMRYVRVIALGVLKEYRLTGVDGLLYRRTAEEALKKGYNIGEFSWILEINEPMRKGIEGLGGTVYKTYRIYEKAL
jgi:GNAT superfamily N-acetyltransferase